MTASDPKTADAVLFQLKSLGAAQAETVAQRLKITVQAVRQRFDRLLAENLVEFADQPRGRGRPRRFWSLTPQAMSLFPDTHAQLTVDLIGTIRSELGEPAFARLLQKRAGEITANYRRRLGGERDMAAKLAVFAEIRSAEGYMARIEELPEGGYMLIEDHCPICATPPLARVSAPSSWTCSGLSSTKDGRSSVKITCSPALAAARTELSLNALGRSDSNGLVLTIPPIVPPESPHRATKRCLIIATPKRYQPLVGKRYSAMATRRSR